MPPVGSVLVAAIVAYVAWQQWRTAHNKLAIDLFDRRYALYLKFTDLLAQRHSEVHHAPNPFPPDFFRWRNYYAAEHEVKLLFGADVAKIVDDLGGFLSDLDSLHNRLLESGLAVRDLMSDPDFKKANSDFNLASYAFERHVRSYITLGHIGRGRVSKRPDWEC